MKTNAYFVSSVAIALVVPIVIGSFCFLDVYRSKNESTYVSKMVPSNELVLLGKTEVEMFDLANIQDAEYDKGNYLEFEVGFMDGNTEFTNYDLSLEGIEFSPNVIPQDVYWKLLKFDSSEKEYKIVSSGAFGEEDKIKVAIRESINLKENQKYRLYYYISSEENQYNRGTMHAKMAIEQE